MAYVSTFVIGKETIKVYDESARTQAAQASSKADAATQTANEVSSKVNAVSSKADAATQTANEASGKADAASAKAEAATQTANEASGKADAASAKIDEIAALSRLEISYSEVNKTITITTSNHEG